MKLDSEDFIFWMINCGSDLTRVSCPYKTISQLGHGIAMAHKNGLIRFKAFEQRTGGIDNDFCSSVLFLQAGLHHAAEMLVDELHPVADSENRKPELENARIVGRTFLCPHTRRTAGQHEPVKFTQFSGLSIDGENFRPDRELPDPAVDNLCVLTSAVQDGNAVDFHIYNLEITFSILFLYSRARRRAFLPAIPV